MLKYILKRLFISIFVLLGVSIIIYTLVRMMPNDYLDIKFSSQLQQGTITQEQLQMFKEQYGKECRILVDYVEGNKFTITIKDEDY